MYNNTGSVVNIDGYCNINVTIRENGGMIPTLKTYFLKVKLICIKDESGCLYINELTDVKQKVTKALDLPVGTTILNKTSFIGREDNIKISLEVITNSHYIRRVKTDDIVDLPYAFLQKISNEIINNVKGINRVVYDISSKPPATIEWE